MAMLRHIVQLQRPAEEDIQPVVVRIRTEAVHLAVDTEPVVDTVIVAGIVVVPVSVLEQEQGMEWMLHYWWDTWIQQQAVERVQERQVTLD